MAARPASKAPKRIERWEGETRGKRPPAAKPEPKRKPAVMDPLFGKLKKPKGK